VFPAIDPGFMSNKALNPEVTIQLIMGFGLSIQQGEHDHAIIRF